MWLAAIFIIIGIASRLIPHVPNFSPLVAVALFSGVYWKKPYGYLLPLSIYIISDLIIGTHNTMAFTWLSIIMIYGLGTFLAKKRTVVTTGFYAIISSVLFFVVTNLGVWMMGWYPPTLEGLSACFTYAIPFFRTSLAANLVYVVVLFGSYEYFSSRVKLTKATA
ncbi:MAG: hypothetical protein K9L86_04130 [Candidatus Omnitrophica bacterium]|nr:hypothetical protein [Candidatus Omnitrophota bacterium]